MKITLLKGNPHNYTYRFTTGRVKRVGDFIVFREPFELVQVCDDCGHTIAEYCIGGYAPVDALGGEDNGEH